MVSSPVKRRLKPGGRLRPESRLEPTPSSLAKRARLQQLLSAVYEEGVSTRASLTLRLGWSAPSVTRLTTELREHGFVEEIEPESANGRGRPSRPVTLVPERVLALGIEIAPQAVRWTLIDSLGRAIGGNEHSLAAASADARTLDEALTIAREGVVTLGAVWDAVRAITVTPHGYVTADGVWEEHAADRHNLFDVRAHVERTTGRRVVVEDVARAFAVAERRNDPEAPSDALYLLFGTNSLGSGLFTDGALMRTRLGICGEVGHVVVVPDGRPCDCGRRGCLAQYVSASALLDVYRREMPTKGNEDATFSLPVLCERSRNGDPLARQALLSAVGLLCRGLATSIAIAGTPVVVLGGELIDAGPELIEAIEAELKRRIVPSLADHVAVRYATQGRHSAAGGGALLALDAYWRAPDLH